MNQELINQTHGRIFGCEFIKKDGTVRKMSARTGVKKDVNGTGMAFSPKDRGMQVVYDMNKGGHRIVTLNRVVKFQCGNLSFSK